MKVKDKVVVVTGASSGIGLATATLLSSKGAKVALIGRNKKKLEQLANKLPDTKAFVCDMRKEKEVREMIGKVNKYFGRIDILINNAGRGYDSSIEKISTKNYKELFALNILGPLAAMQEVIPIMRKGKNGAIINISSGTSVMNIPGIGAYSSLKRALVGISLTAREELKNDGISVSIVYPFITSTNFYKNIMGNPREQIMPANSSMPEADSAEFVAERILQVIASGDREIFAHDWMGK